MGHRMAVAYCLNGSSHDCCILFEWVIVWLLHIVWMSHRMTIAYCLNESSHGYCILFEWVIAWLLHIFEWVIAWLLHIVRISHRMTIAYCSNGSSHGYCILFEWVIAWLLHPKILDLVISLIMIRAYMGRFRQVRLGLPSNKTVAPPRPHPCNCVVSMQHICIYIYISSPCIWHTIHMLYVCFVHAYYNLLGVDWTML